MAGRLHSLIAEQPFALTGVELFRFEGAAFGVLVPSAGDREQLAMLAHHLKTGMLQTLEVAGREYHFTLSIGAALAPDHGRDAEALFKNAEVVVNRVRAEGGNNFRLFSAELGEQREQIIMLERGLRQAMAHGELTLHYQPQVDLRENRITGIEALLRWNSAAQGRVSPAQFIPLAEETGLIVPIGHWVLRTACLQAQRWSEAKLAPVTLAVNISARQLQHPDFVTSVADVLRETGLDPARLELEITESVAMQDAEQTVATLNALRRLGVRLAIDDFGTGFSSLSYLQRFPLDKVKVDQSFVRGIAHDATIALSVILLARSLQLGVIAEGVETREQVDTLRTYGCEEMQGYYFGHPMPAEEIETLLRSGHRLVA
jgi:EAL domain-containing protein (putative c-di-GMP-specific phosphodiesterase class I)